MTEPQPTQAPEAAETNPPPAVPRPVTPLARRGAWVEPRVRSWWLIAVLLLIVTLALLAQQLRTRSRESSLLRDGLRIDAKVLQIDGVYLVGKHYPPDTTAELQFTLPDGKDQKVIGALDGRATDVIIGETVPIRVDANDPQHWTAATEPTPLSTLFLGMIIPVSAVVLVGLVTLVKRSRLLRTWQGGEAAELVVLETKHSAIAPRSTLVRGTPARTSDPKVVSVYVPRPVAQGEAVWVLFPPGRLHRAVAAEWFG